MAWTQPRTWVSGELETAAIFNAHVRDNLQSGPIAATVTALNALFNGTPGDGARGYIRVGSSPFDLVELAYDASVSKWQQPQPLMLASIPVAVNTSSTTYTQAAAGPLMPYKVFTDAGLALYFRFVAAALAGA